MLSVRLTWVLQGFQFSGSGALRPSRAIQKRCLSASSSIPSHLAYSRISGEAKSESIVPAYGPYGPRLGRHTASCNSRQPAVSFPPPRLLKRCLQNGVLRNERLKFCRAPVSHSSQLRSLVHDMAPLKVPAMTADPLIWRRSKASLL